MCRITALARYARSGGPSDDGRRHLGGYRVGYCVLERHGMHSVVPLRVLLVQAGTTARGPITGRRRDPMSQPRKCERCGHTKKLHILGLSGTMCVCRCPCFMVRKPLVVAGHTDREGADNAER
jgi:hypothetical protein